MEYWRYGTITEDKQIEVQFINDDELPFALDDFLAWGVKILTRYGKILLKAGTVAGHSMENVQLISNTQVQITLPSNIHPKQEVNIYAVSVIEIEELSRPEGKLTDISEEPVFLFKCKRDYD